ncbi:hypothetical protein LCGC14_2576150 [marine sediment metagenome]|uniref:Uncharacterized protein n=1 Tax=marine sediment metagenome TaxID=412755 RepID=A0A0F9D8J7_9ZZZZ
MPFAIRDAPGGKFKVVNKVTGNVHSKATTMAKARGQIAIMERAERQSNTPRTTRSVIGKRPGASNTGHKSGHGTGHKKRRKSS